jgi:hypothetical protein
VSSFGILKLTPNTTREDTDFTKLRFELYTKRRNSLKLIFDHNVFVYYKNETAVSGERTGFRLTNLECFRDLSELLLRMKVEHKVLALENGRLRLVKIYGEIKVAQPDWYTEDEEPRLWHPRTSKRRVGRSVKDFELFLKKIAEIVLGKVSVVENWIAAKLKVLFKLSN